LVVVATVLASLVAPQHLAWAAPATRILPSLDLPLGSSVDLPYAASHVVLRWDGDATAQVELRWADEGGAWQPWQAATIDEDGGASQESGMFVVTDAVKLQARVVSGRAAHLKAVVIDVENGPRRLVLRSSVAPAGAINGATGQPPVITRAQWGADESLRKGTPDFAAIQRMDVHHTVTTNNDPNPAATVRAIYVWHTQGNGWNDIGYNFLIDASGNVYEGRYARSYANGEAPTGENPANLGVIGAHTLNHNPGTVGIALLGTFNTVAPSAAAQSSLTKLMAWEADRHGLDPTAPGVVLGHRDLYETECPGNVAYGLLPAWRQQANQIKVLSYPPGNTPGYWIAGADGSVGNYGNAANYGSMAGRGLNSPIVSMTRTADGKGYWLMGGDGGIFSFGSAQFYGSMGGRRLNQPVVGLAPTPSGQGYWLVARDGGIFAFGDAQFYGSMGGHALNQPVVGIASTPSGHGYWMVASDGGIFAFGDAQFYGSTGSIRLNQPVVAMAAAPNGHGYWLFARDGGVFAYNVPFMGSIPMLQLSSFSQVTQAAATQTGNGYYLLGRDGGMYTFGDARFWGTQSLTAAGMALVPTP